MKKPFPKYLLSVWWLPFLFWLGLMNPLPPALPPAGPEVAADTSLLESGKESPAAGQERAAAETGPEEEMLELPDAPEALAFNPNSISGLNAADPSAGIVVIPPPGPNHLGAAVTSFPLKVPPGRQGMFPELALEYNSDAPNGWLGTGWSMDLPAIYIETRWGVPRYDPALESETYSLDGQMLAPMAHRDPTEPRRAERRFHLRVEGPFHRIIRHGDSPRNYWWEVAAKDGYVQYFGGRPGEGLLDGAVLKDDRGNIARWQLVETRDRNENTVVYDYALVTDPGVAGGTVPGRELYPFEIAYTGHADSRGPFTVRFLRDRDLGEARRPDASISGRLGFKQVNADLLRRVEMRYRGELVRTYELTYAPGAFSKTLLQSVTEIDREGNPFYRHDFEYFEGPGANGTLFSAEERWPAGTDNLRGDIINPLPGFENTGTLLGSTKSSGFSIGGAATIGPIGDLATKINTAGANYTYTNSSGEGLSVLVDLNGDELPDKVFREAGENRLYYRPNQGDGFGERRALSGVSQFNVFRTTSNSIGAEANPLLAFVGYENTTSETDIETYFSDINGDGLLDIVSRGRVFFNRINAQGDPEFNTSSADTPNPIVAGAAPDPDLVLPDPGEQDRLIDEFPLHDVVRTWEVPYDGQIAVDAPVRLLEDTSPAARDYDRQDGVRVAVQLAGNELWAERIPAGDYAERDPVGLDNLIVTKGQRLYFRVQSVFDGAYDQVRWDPEIRYLNLPPEELDANCKPVARFRASEDFLLASAQTLSIGLDGTVNIEGQFEKPLSSDDLTVEVLRLRGGAAQVVLTLDLAWDETGIFPIESTGLAVQAGDEFAFRVRSRTNIDWTAIRWQPRLYFTATDNGNPVQDPQGNYLLDFLPVVEYNMYNELVQRTGIWFPPQAGNVEIRPLLDPNTNLIEPVEVTLSAKGKNSLLGRETFQVTGAGIAGNPQINLSVQDGDTLYIEYHVARGPTFLPPEQLQLAAPEVLLNGAPQNVVAGQFWQKEDAYLFGPQYRGWGQFVYNGNRDRADQPINEGELDLNLPQIDSSDLEDIEDPGDIEIGYDPKTAPLIVMVAFPELGAWVGNDNLTYVTDTLLSSSRMGNDDILVETAGTGASAPALKTRAEENALSGGLSAIGISGSGGAAWGTFENLLDVMDMNGDQYPDLVTPEEIQYTNPLGGLEADPVPHSLGSHQAKSFALGGGIGGDFVNTSPSNSGTTAGQASRKKSGRTKAKSNKSSKNSSEAGQSSEGSGGFSGGINLDRDSTVFSWEDINGDGLPDKIYEDGRAALNLGYRFAPPENWGFQGIRGGLSQDLSAGLGVNIANGSIEAGLSLSSTRYFSNQGFQDLNGDGLIDKIRSTDPVRVQLNTGSGFGPPIPWNGVDTLDTGTATGESLNQAVTICVPIPIPVFPLKFCLNPSSAQTQALSRETSQLVDVDGDGLADLLRSDQDDQLRVRRSTIGKANMLREIRRPLGATITLDYEQMANSYALAGGKWVLAEVSVDDGFAGDGEDVQKTQVEYRGGYYDRFEREFYGFDTLLVRELDTGSGDAPYRTIVEVYRTRDFFRRGLLQSRYLLDGEGQKRWEMRNTFQLQRVVSGADTLAGSFFPALTDSRELYFRSGELLMERVRTYQYDELGNTIAMTDSGDGSPEDRLETRITYHQGPGYYRSFPARVEVRSGEGVLRSRSSELDDRGNLARLRQQTGAGEAVYDMTYDQYGNRIRLLRPENFQGERLTYDFTYDADIHTYLVAVEDSYGYVSTQEFDPVFGQMTALSDINGQPMQLELDPRGRVVRLTGPRELAAGLDYTIRFEYHPEAAVPWARTLHYDPEQQSDIEMVVFLDGLLRPVQDKATGSIFQGDGQPDREVLIVSGAIHYDAFGRPVREFFPLTEPAGDPGQINTGIAPEAPRRMAYDVLDRLILDETPSGSQTRYAYELSETVAGRNVPGFLVRTTDALGNQQEVYHDLRNRQVAVVDKGPGGDIQTRFQYNALSELTSVIDHAGNPIRYTYDQLGRKTSREHPVAGLTAYRYDPAGNLLEKVTANLRALAPGAAIRYTYEQERLVQIDYPKNFQNRVQFHYGEPDAQHNRAGRIWLVEDASGGQEFFFDEMGNPDKSIRSLIITEANVRTFVTEYTYDSWGRLQTLLYPDGEVVDYQYNRAGQLSGMSSVKSGFRYPLIDQVGYDRFGQQVFRKFGNGTRTSYAYDPLGRDLQRLSVSSPQGGSILDLTYQYDEVGNILTLENNAPAPASRPGGTFRHGFQYDQLYRLIEAEGSWNGAASEKSYQLSFGYDELQNLSYKTQEQTNGGARDLTNSYELDYRYEGDRPYVPSHISDRRYTFDANGNQLGWTRENGLGFRQMIWDEEDRLMGISDEGYMSRFTYDAAHVRVIKSHGGSRGVFISGAPAGFVNHEDNYTAYVNPYLSSREDSFTKHYFAEGQRIASRKGTGEFDNKYWYGRGITAGGLNFTERIRQLQLAAEAYYRQLGVPPGPPTLPGYYAQPEYAGQPIPPSGDTTAYNSPPPGWTGLIGPPDPNGPPGPPIWYGEQVTRDNVRAGFGFRDAGAFEEADQLFYHGDHLGNVNFVTDRQGNVRAHTAYLPTGEVLVRQEPTPFYPSFMFNEQEFDAESGLYYFGARYYDARASLWQSVDPHADNYFGWSPYHFAAHNPVLVTDPDGKDWTISRVVDGKGNVQVDLRFKAVVRNQTDQNIDGLDAEIARQVENAYRGKYRDKKGRKVTVRTQADVATIGRNEAVPSDAHLFSVEQPGPYDLRGLRAGEVNKIGGKEIFLNAENVVGKWGNPSILRGENAVTVPHEVGHTLGLYHPDKAEGLKKWKKSRGLYFKRPVGGNNLMFSNTPEGEMIDPKQRTKLLRRQLRSAVRNVRKGRVNKE